MKLINIKAHLDLYSFLDKGIHIIYCPSLDMSGYGNTEDEAYKSFEIVFTNSIEYMVNKNTLYLDFKKHGLNVHGKMPH